MRRCGGLGATFEEVDAWEDASRTDVRLELRRGRGGSSCDAGADAGSVDDDDSAAAVDDEDEGSMGQSTADGKWTLAMAVAAAMALGEDGDEVAEGN